jgi:hypothetical protein
VSRLRGQTDRESSGCHSILEIVVDFIALEQAIAHSTRKLIDHRPADVTEG